MYNRLIQTVKERSIVELIIASLSILIGLLISYESAYLIYAYHCTGILFFFMLPMTTLVSNLIIGLTLCLAGFYLLTNHCRLTLFYKLSGILIILYPINEIILDFIRYGKTYGQFGHFIFLPFGIFLYFFIRQKKYAIHENNYPRLKSDKIKLLISILVYSLIDILFYPWSYL